MDRETFVTRGLRVPGWPVWPVHKESFLEECWELVAEIDTASLQAGTRQRKRDLAAQNETIRQLRQDGCTVELTQDLQQELEGCYLPTDQLPPDDFNIDGFISKYLSQKRDNDTPRMIMCACDMYFDRRPWTLIAELSSLIDGHLYDANVLQKMGVPYTTIYKT